MIIIMTGVIMPAVKNTITKTASSHGIISETVKNHQNDPFVLKQAAAAKTLLNRPGVQEQLKELSKKYEEKA